MRLLQARDDLARPPVAANAHWEDTVRTDSERPEDSSSDRLLLTTEKAADVLGVGRTTVYALIRRASYVRCT